MPPPLETRNRSSKIKSYGPAYIWYCGNCGDGPHNAYVLSGCSECGHIRDRCCTVTSTGLPLYSPPSSVALSQYGPSAATPVHPDISHPAPRSAYSVPSVSYAQASNTISSNIEKPTFPTLTDLVNELDEIVAPKDVFPEPLDHEPHLDNPEKPPSISMIQPTLSVPDISSITNVSEDQLDSNIIKNDDGEFSSLSENSASTGRKAAFLAHLILQEVSFNIDFEAKVVHCAGHAHSSGRSSTQYASSSRRGDDSSSSTGSNSESCSGSGSGSKRRREEGQDEGSGGSKQPDSKKSKAVNTSSERRLACPFYKRNPRARSLPHACSTTSWNLACRVKEHLTRKHRVYQCANCWDVFRKPEDLTTHIQQQLVPCTIRPERPVFGINQTMAKKLEARLPFKSDEEANWRWLFSELFPFVPEDCIPSPYLDEEDCHNDDAFFEDVNVECNREHGRDQFQAVLPARTLQILQRRIELLSQGSEDHGHRNILEATRNGEFGHALEQSILEAMGGLYRDNSREQQTSREAIGSTTDQSPITRESSSSSSRTSDFSGIDQSYAPLSGNLLDGEFRPDDWVINLDFDADAMILNSGLPHEQLGSTLWTNLQDVHAEPEQFGNPMLLDIETLPSHGLYTEDENFFEEGPTFKETQFVVAANRQIHKAAINGFEDNSWFPEVDGNLFGPEYQNSKAGAPAQRDESD